MKRDALAATDMIRVEVLANEESAQWDAFVDRCPEATFFHRFGWKSIMEEVFRHRTHYLVAKRGEEWLAILPLAENKSVLFGHSLVSLPFCVYGGCASIDPEATLALHRHAENLGRTLGASFLELRNVEQREAAWPRQDLYVTFRKKLEAEDEANMLAIPRKQRAMVRKGIKNGLLSHIDPTAERFFALYADNVHRHGTPALSRRYFESLVRVFGKDCEVLTVTDAQGTPLSSVLSFYFRDEVLPYYAGDDVRVRDTAANDFKYWELMRHARARGCNVFDYGRSKVGTGSYDFKRNWGFEPTPLHYEYALYKCDSVPQNNPLNPKYRAFIALWRKLPIGVANAIGPHIVRSLG